jgi:hypothetical protein
MANLDNLVVYYLYAWQNYIFYALAATVFWKLCFRAICYRPLVNLVMLLPVFLHELLHFIVGAITNAKPNSFSIIPNRVKAGSVGFTNIRWYNAIPTALAPLLGLVSLSVAAIHGLPSNIHNITGQGALVLFALSPLLYGCWPSSVDWKLSLRGWPVYVGGIVYLVYRAG